MIRLLLLVSTIVVVAVSNRTVVVSGATGRSGSIMYKLLKEAGMSVRGIVRNVSKARKVLRCSKCDESEGIFMGDITNQSTLARVMVGADSLVITTGVSSSEGAKEILFDGVENQVGAFLSSPGLAPKDRHVLMLSMQETTLLDTFWNKILARLWGGWSVGFYALQGEAFLMNANVPYTILKACGLDDTPAGKKQLLVGHDDKGWNMMHVHTVSRNDVARVLATATANPSMAANLRFDFCAQDGTSQPEMEALKEAMYSWDPRKKADSTSITVV